MKKILLILVMSIFLFSLVSAECSLPNPVKKGDTIQLTTTCSNCTSVNITKVIYPNQTLALLGEFLMTSNSTNFNFSFSDTDAVGKYSYTTSGDLNGISTQQSCTFEVTPTGSGLTTSKSIIFVSLLFLLVFLFMIDIGSLALVPKENNRDAESGEIVSINMLRHLRPVLYGFAWGLLLSILFISSNIAFAFLGTELFAKFLFVLFQIMFALTPIIVIFWGWYLLYHVVQDIAINKILKQGGSVF